MARYATGADLRQRGVQLATGPSGADLPGAGQPPSRFTPLDDLDVNGYQLRLGDPRLQDGADRDDDEELAIQNAFERLVGLPVSKSLDEAFEANQGDNPRTPFLDRLRSDQGATDHPGEPSMAGIFMRRWRTDPSEQTRQDIELLSKATGVRPPWERVPRNYRGF